jgi:membrane protein YqaA with SNARE-associated domain
MLGLMALPQYGLSTLFIVAFISATLLPLGSEPALLGLVKLNPELFWPAVLIATAGNTLGGVVTWWMGYGAEVAYEHVGHHDHADTAAAPNSTANSTKERARRWLARWGAKACLLSWLPIVGDPLCAVAGWLRLPFWPCVGYMAIGKCARYLTMTLVMQWAFPQHFAG